MRVHRIEATIVVDNRRSGRVLEKVGFRLEGRRRRAARLSGRWADEAIFGLLRPELRDGS
jgi:ribosomal-protein-alanine N-acetyltransferase